MHVTVVTGASAGIGYETAKQLALAGHRLALVGRNPERTERAARELRASTSNPHIRHYLSDFSSLDSVRQLAADIQRDAGSIDLLINNAGLWHQERRESADGFEDTFAVNHLAPFLLTQLLLPSMPAGRIVFVSSRLHEEAGAFDFDDLLVRDRPYRGLEVYGRTKLANVLTANEFARRLHASGTPITVNSVHPGSVNTNIVRDNAILSVLIRVAPFIRTAAEGAETTVYAATHPALANVTGAYFSDSRQVPPSPHARDLAAARRLWEMSLEYVGLDADALDPRVQENDGRVRT